jgi:hypothetical protein
VTRHRSRALRQHRRVCGADRPFGAVLAGFADFGPFACLALGAADALARFATRLPRIGMRRKAARSLGITLPPAMLLRANRVVE